MNATTLDTITAAFVDALKTGQGALAQYSLPLLAVFAVIAFYLHVGPLVMSGGAGVGDAVGSVLLSVVKTGVFFWLLTHCQRWPETVLQRFS